MDCNYNNAIIDDKYTIIEKIGSGLTSKVFKVKPKDINTEIYYAAKAFKLLKGNNTKKTSEEMFETEKELLNKLKKVESPSPYIINIIDSGKGILNLINSGKGKIIENDKNEIEINYIILDYAENGCLFDYIYYPEKPLDEDLCKLFFYKIFKAIKLCHDAKICNRDIKLDNILLDNNYNPKICDFGFGTISEDGEVSGKLGTYNYMAPEIFSKSTYNGFKVDIFNLAIALYILITGKVDFTAIRVNPTAKLLYQKKYERFWNTLKDLNQNLTNEFKELFIKMTNSEKIRPTINEILKDKWFDNLNDEKIRELEEEIKMELDQRKEKIKEGKKTEMKIECYQVSSLLGNRGIEEDNVHFNENINPKYIDIESVKDNYIIIKGNMSPHKIMDTIYNKIEKTFENECIINIKDIDQQESLKFNIIFEEEININENDGEGEGEVEEDEDNIIENNLIIEIKFFETYNGHLIRFKRKCGELYDYYEKVKQINTLIKKAF